jgi:cholinesterase
LVGNNNDEAEIFSVEAMLGGSPPLPAAVIAQMNLAFVCPALAAAKGRRDNGIKAWRYRYFGDWPNQNISSNGDPGAYHGSELGMVWGTTQAMSGGVPNTLAEEQLEKLMMTAWASFAKDPHTGLSKLGWPLWDETGMNSSCSI